MVYPNNECINFCYWMLNTSWQQLTAPRRELIQLVYDAGINGDSVTDQEFNNFTQTTAWRYEYYTTYKNNQFPYSTPPVGTCHFWFNPSGLRLNTTNNFGIVDISGIVSKIKDILSSTISADQSAASRNPFLITNPNNFYFSNSIGLNVSSNSQLQLTNANALTNNVAGFTTFIIGQGGTSATTPVALGFAIGIAAAGSRFTTALTAAGNWSLFTRRLDADAAQQITGGSSLTVPKIVCSRMDWANKTGTIFENGIITAQNNNMGSAGNTSATNSIGCWYGGYNATLGFPGTLSDALAFQGALSDADVVTITDWLNSMRNIF